MKNKNKELIKNLEIVGFTPLEARVYLYILENGVSKVTKVYKSLKMDKSSTYRIVDELVDAGLLTRIGEKYGQEFMANDPENLKELVKKKQNEIKVASNTISKLIEEVSENAAKKYKDYNISVYEGVEGYYKAMEKRLEVGADEIYEISGDYPIPKDYWDYIPDFIDRRVKKGIYLKSLVPAVYKDKKFEQSDDELLKEVRILPEGFKNKTLIGIFDEYTTIANMASGRRLSLVIKDKLIAQVMKSLFELIWKSAKLN